MAMAETLHTLTDPDVIWSPQWSSCGTRYPPGEPLGQSYWSEACMQNLKKIVKSSRQYAV